MISFYSFHVTPKQDYLHSIHFHSFPFLNFKTSNQGYLIPFFSIPFPYLNTFHSFPFHSLMTISFHSILSPLSPSFRKKTKPSQNHPLQPNTHLNYFLTLQISNQQSPHVSLQLVTPPNIA